MAVASRPRNQAEYEDGIRHTRQTLDTFDDASLISVTNLGLADIHALKREVSEIFPASNLPAFLLQGLIQLDDRRLKHDRITADLRVLFRGTKQLGLYGTFLAAPALVLYGYQRLLTLAGKDVDSAFPHGPWQFYTQFGLREDAARHCVETAGFGRARPEANDLDAATAWVCAAIWTLYAYDDLLANEWQEHILLHMIDQLVVERAAASAPAGDGRARVIAQHSADLRKAYGVEGIGRAWAERRPYHGGAITTPGGYPAYRAERFNTFMAQALHTFPDDLRATLAEQFASRRASELPAYQQQLTLCQALCADTYQEQLLNLPLDTLCVGVVVQGRYYLIDACARDDRGRLLVFPADNPSSAAGVPLLLHYDETGQRRDMYGNLIEIGRNGSVSIAGRALGFLRPPPIAQLKARVAAMFRQPAGQPSDVDLHLVRTPRPQHRLLRGQLGNIAQAELALLRTAPILINWDGHDGVEPLPVSRLVRRGCGDHALTLIRNDQRMLFDMSHIFFDALWGMALAEIMTGFATGLFPQVAAARVAGALPIQRLRPPERAVPVPYSGVQTLVLEPTPDFMAAAHRATTVPAEAAAETAVIDLHAMSRLRRRLVKIHLNLTVNDLLLLARLAHAARYQPSKLGQEALRSIADLQGGANLVQQIMGQIQESRTVNPSLLIPMDATPADPRMRLYPATFRNPLPELLPNLEACAKVVNETRRLMNQEEQITFEEQRRALYRDLWAFAGLMRALRDVTIDGQSFTTSALRLMAHLPGPLQYWVDQIPQRIGVLNEILKGREVFSNVGQVVPSSSLTRFSSARDDGDTKHLVWGMMSDANGRMVVTLRDFRLHVDLLQSQGRGDLARDLAQDYLDSYANTVNDLVRGIQRILAYR